MVLKGIVMNHFFMNFLVKKAISPSNLSRPPPTIAPLPAPSTSASRPLYPRFRTLYPRFRTLNPLTPAPPVHPLQNGNFMQKNQCFDFKIVRTVQNFYLFLCEVLPLHSDARRRVIFFLYQGT